MEDSVLVEINNLKKKYKDFELNIEKLEIYKGMIVGFVGENGSGKTTTIKLMMGLKRRYNGEIKIMGRTPDDLGESVKSQIGYVGDTSIFYYDMTVKNQVKSLSAFYKTFDTKMFYELAEKFKLPINKKLKSLSQGNKQLFYMIFNLSYKPSLLILDEATTGLDPAKRSDILDIILEWVEKYGMTVFFSSHITTDIEHIADRVVFIKDGSILLDKNKDDIMTDYLKIKGYNKFLTDQTKDIFITVKKGEYSFEGLTEESEKVRELFGQEVIYERPTLDDIFIAKIRG